jgi:uncharacterized coiled-coil protein SlyX
MVLDINSRSDFSSSSALPHGLSQASFGVPPVFVPSAWNEHTPFALWLINALRPGVFVELGTHYGQSYFTFCQAVEAAGGRTLCYAVDTWRGDEHAGHYGEEVWHQVASTNAERYSAFSTLVRKTFDGALGLFADGSIDLLHIDGRHFYEDVLHDFTSWLPKVSGRGVILLHDTNVHERNFGVARLWQELKGQYPHFSFLHGYGLGVLAVGREVPSELRRLTDLPSDSEAAAAVRLAYARLGAAISDRSALRDERKAAAALRGELEALRDDVAAARRTSDLERAKAEHLAASLEEAHRQGLSAQEAFRQRLSEAREQARRQVAEFEGRAAESDRRAAEQAELATAAAAATAALRQRIAELEAALDALAADVSAARADIAGGSRQVGDLRVQLEQAEALRAAMIASTSWRITWPMRALKRAVSNPALVRQKGFPAPADDTPNPALSEAAAPEAAAPAAQAARSATPVAAVNAADAIRARFAHIQPPRVFRIPGHRHRVTMVTDSISEGSVFGGVGTAMVLASTIARHTGAVLRVVTRTEPPHAANFAAVMAVHGMPQPADVEFAFNPVGGSHELDVSDNELFLTTSWWTTSSFRKVVRPGQIIYLLQEDERMFYPSSDERLFCQETLADETIRFVVNSRMLFDHLTEGDDALPNLKARGTWFEPAFPAAGNRHAAPGSPPAKRRFFFYARPNNLRNLYWHGLQAILEGIEEDILDPDAWDFHFAGRDLTALELPRGVRPVLHQNLPWADYVALTRTVDVGLSLMATPHPSYPPLDLALAGAVVVTNKYGHKTSLDRYSDAIICVDPTVPALKQGLAAAVRRTADRQPASTRGHIEHDWSAAFQPVLDRFFQPAHQA